MLHRSSAYATAFDGDGGSTEFCKRQHRYGRPPADPTDADYSAIAAAASAIGRRLGRDRDPVDPIDLEPGRRIVDGETVLLAVRQNSDDRYRTGRRRRRRGENGFIGPSGAHFEFHNLQTPSIINRSAFNHRASNRRTHDGAERWGAERWDKSYVVDTMTNLQTGPLQWSRDMAAHCRLFATRSARPAYIQHLLALADVFDADVAKLSPKPASNE